ncbi:mitochondrial import receptor subunit TOM40B-like isoform X1 [Huso huso]|uniref:Mitochondrial import receptor subunit TOM40B-like isoform X1 n=1 Tax=Huso huso TaxID=61971 RepID=A0ABR0YA38_HUSHU
MEWLSYIIVFITHLNVLLASDITCSCRICVQGLPAARKEHNGILRLCPQRWDKRDGRLPNPGGFDMLHRRCKDVFPHQTEGVKLTINRTISTFFKASHILHLSAVGPSSYRFNASYQQSDSDRREEVRRLFYFVIKMLTSLSSRDLYFLSLSLSLCLSLSLSQTQRSQFLVWQFETEYRGDDFTAAVTLANPDLLRESVIMVAHFLQSVSPQLVLGGELVYHRGRAEEGGIVTLAGQYSGPNWVATLNAGNGGAHASYYHRANKQIQVGVEFEASTRTQETTCSFGYQLDIPEANMVFRGKASSLWLYLSIADTNANPWHAQRGRVRWIVPSPDAGVNQSGTRRRAGGHPPCASSTPESRAGAGVVGWGWVSAVNHRGDSVGTGVQCGLGSLWARLGQCCASNSVGKQCGLGVTGLGWRGDGGCRLGVTVGLGSLDTGLRAGSVLCFMKQCGDTVQCGLGVTVG